MQRTISRRSALKLTAATLATLAINPSLPSAAPTPPFPHRGYLGWITDLASTPDTNAPWPSMRLDQALLEDYRQAFSTLHSLNFNNIVIWGLYVASDWPLDIPSAVPPDRGRLVEQLIDAAHAQDLRVLSGLGVYSWGFDKIIHANPSLARGNSRAMCPSNPDAWPWMQKVIDFVFARFPIDGVSMQSADQGRCPCPQCKSQSDAEYHTRLNARVADYIRSRYKNKVVAVNNWGMSFFPKKESLPHLVQLSKSVDYIIDVNNSALWAGPDYRKQLASALSCPYGTLGGPQVEPPQHWPRDRWFLPTAKRNAAHLADLAADSGRACEYFFHIAANPADELSLHVTGKALANPTAPLDSHLQSSIEALYNQPRPTTRDALAQFFLAAEDAYFKHLPKDTSGTISLEPLVGNHPGPPIYLTDRLTPAQRTQYATDLQSLRADFQKLLPDIPHRPKADLILRCLTNVLRDLAGTSSSPSPSGRGLG